MENISNLLKEAKPMYLARKRRNNIIKTTLSMLVCVVMLGIYAPRSGTSFYDLYENIDKIQSGSVLEDMGLPVDEYGLLMV